MVSQDPYDKKYEELYAKNCLETIFPHIFHNIQDSDRPDLKQDDLFGIEVTRIGFQAEQMVMGLWNRNIWRTRDEMKKDAEKIDELNPTFDEQGRLIAIDPPEDKMYGAVDFRSAIIKKLNCLNSPDFDSHFKYNCLFIYDEDNEHQTDISQIIHIFQMAQITFEKKFDVLFVWDGFRLHSYSSTPLSNDMLNNIKAKALADREKIGFTK